jgi:hypothetical protein
MPQQQRELVTSWRALQHERGARGGFGRARLLEIGVECGLVHHWRRVERSSVTPFTW